jgi:hypothetical protein
MSTNEGRSGDVALATTVSKKPSPKGLLLSSAESVGQ